jgi:hypothetical protein
VRFKREIPLREVEEFVGLISVNLTQTVEAFRLTYSRREPMLEYDVLERYNVGS